MRRTTAAVCLALCLLNTAAPQRRARAESPGRTAAVEEDPAQYVNPFVGTEGDGNTFPGATVPFGMVQWSPDTKKDGFYRFTGGRPRAASA
jgi:putative alpha-1,2-mannosidase